MLKFLACLFKGHEWVKTTHDDSDFGSVEVRTCSRCGKRQRWFADLFDPTGQSGYWMNLSGTTKGS